jgi:hypothetical protein
MLDRKALTHDFIVSKYVLPRLLTEPEGFCWKWRGQHSKNGYARIRVPRKEGGWQTCYVHRMLCGGNDTIPHGHQVDHKCGNAWCVNPGHLEVVTQLENFKRSRAYRHMAARDDCKNGHAYSSENTGYAKRDGARVCKACMRENARNRRARNRL